MKNLKKIFVFLILGLLSFLAVAPGFISRNNLTANATEDLEPYENNFTYTAETRGYEVDIKYKVSAGLEGTLALDIKEETDTEIFKRFEKYCKKQIDTASVGEVFYVTPTYSNEEDLEKYTTISIKVKLPKFLQKKELAVIAFTDYRSTKKLTPVTASEDGYITFFGYEDAYAYAIIYNGAYKQLILIGIILVTVLVICVLVKIYCLRKDNPMYQEKKKAKAIKRAKEQHHQNRILDKARKREKEKQKKQAKQ